MGLRKILTPLLSLSLSFGAVIYWNEKTVELKVPKNSVVVIELPCVVLRTFYNDLVHVKVSGNGVFISVLENPTSVGISCKKGNVYRNYSFYLFPINGGVTYVKVIDRKLERAYEKYVLSREKERKIEVKSVGLIQKAEKLMQSLLKGKAPQGFEIIKTKKEKRIRNFLVKIKYLYVGNGLAGIVGKVKNLSYMQKKLTSDMLFEKGTVLVWLEKEGWLKPEEEVSFVVIKKLSKGRVISEDFVVPYIEGG
ncbi:MAG TPA: hypothetical protein EYH58_05950 [Aquifex aeolicus]|nr:hypothetical protein [Aquifex aeolicus]